LRRGSRRLLADPFAALARLTDEPPSGDFRPKMDEFPSKDGRRCPKSDGFVPSLIAIGRPIFVEMTGRYPF
jgi:hypothetical protein